MKELSSKELLIINGGSGIQVGGVLAQFMVEYKL